MLRHRSVVFPLLILAVFSLIGCDGDDGENTAQDMTQNVELNIAVCAPDAGPFSLDIDNPFAPFPVGQRLILEGEDDEGTTIRVEITVLDETEEVAGVTTRVVEEREFEDGELIEVSRNFFVQAPDRTVCYYGEDVQVFEDGEVVSNEGQWRAGEGDNQPGIFMPGEPAVGQTFARESAPGIAEDQGEITAMGESVTVPAGEFSNTLRLLEQNPLDGDEDEKVFASGTGIIVDEDVELIEMVELTPLSLAVCAPDAGPFSATIDNPFSPFPVGQQSILEGEDDEGTTVRVEITVFDETEEVAGVTTRVVEEREFEDGELIEVSRNFFAQAPDGTVCYYGEDVQIFEDGEVVSNEGQWRAGEGDNQPGIFMPGEPAVGQTFALEAAPGIAEDHAEIIAMGETVTVPAGEFSNTLRLLERNPFNGDQDEKVFAADVGLIVDADIQLIGFEM